ncbi:polyphosphate kinase 1 [Paenibacillus antri]|uniref:Polyphosphate kinase n=1 Tax=Paenibacillus antri TaxID=2582848 RepID=A0A5R9G3S9_9BACL|nr:polyphosphate kinase 1 [Paenibacillus antri]TLS51037.1 polyphosphate kinase 1 [Paenibacillus antri]
MKVNRIRRGGWYGVTKKDHAARDVSNRYVNRDLSWLQFNRRVLEEAQDPDTPLLERVKFLSIVSSNFDEFMSVRVAGMIDQIKAGYQKKDFSGYTPSGLVKRIMKRTGELVHDQYKTYRELMRLLAKEGICCVSEYDDLNATQRAAMDRFYHDIVFPVLTPMAVDQSRPFPLVHTLGVYLAVVLRRDGDIDEEPYFAIVQVPSILQRTVQLPRRQNSKKLEFILMETIIKRHIHSLFTGYVPIAVHSFRLTRNADMTLNEEGAEDLLEEIEKELRKRRWGSPVRLEIEKGMHPYALEMLQEEFEVDDHVFVYDGPLDLTFLMKFAATLPGYDALRYPPVKPVYPKELVDEEGKAGGDLFAAFTKQDVLVHHPYESFDAVTDFVTQAAHDPKVLAIKMTLYRVSGNSLLVQSLQQAAEAGKQVTVVVELKARFDEERNIAWARRLEQSGCHVVYGLVGLKTHAKLLLVVRQESSGLRRYVHVGTGNYNDATAKLYTDVGLFTSHPVIGEDASALFNEMTGYSAPRDWKALSVAPNGLRDQLFRLIRREADNARAGKPARIVAKINSLSHQEIIDVLYEASQAGVKIELIVRGVCSLRPGVPGLSQNVRVISIVDRFLEHSRVFYFENGGDPEVYIASADWMTRNLTRRIELMCPVFDRKIRQSLIHLLELALRDNVKARELLSSGAYARVKGGGAPLRSQFEALKIEKWKVR